VPEAQRPAAAAAARETDGTVSGGFSAPAQSKPRRSVQRSELRAQSVPGDAAAPASIATRIDGKDEDWWRSKFVKLRDKVEDAEANLARCEERDDRNRMDSGLTPMDACAWQVSRVESAEENLEEFEDRAREKGVPPGWLR
jgi:hypothetical protein